MWPTTMFIVIEFCLSLPFSEICYHTLSVLTVLLSLEDLILIDDRCVIVLATNLYLLYSSSLKGFYKDLFSFLTYFSLSVHIFQSVPYFDYNVD